MSGIEAVSLALAFWPVLSTLNELYTSIKDGSASRWALTIKVQERIFKESVFKLLQSDEDLSEKDRVGLVSGDKSFESLWKNADFSNRLESRLDKEMCLLIKHEISEISQLVADLQKKLGDPKADISKKMHLPSMREVKLALRKEDVKKSVDSLAYHNSALRRLLKSCSNTMYADAKAPTPNQHQRTNSQEERQKRIDAQFFDGFHEVLARSFRCNCPTGHQANLSISDTFVMFQNEDSTRAMSGFELRERSATIGSDATVVGDLEDVEDMSELIRSTWSPLRRDSLSTRSCEHAALLVKYSESRGVQQYAPIPDLCQWIHAVCMSPPNSPNLPELQGVLGDDSKQRYTVWAPRQNTSMTIVPMEEWLTSCGTESKKRRVRAELAMNLAATILQFYPTAWIEKTWTWRNFSLARNERGNEPTHSLVITQRFWPKDLARHGSLDSSVTPLPFSPRASNAYPSMVSPRTSSPRVSTTRVSSPSKFWRTFSDLDPMLVRLGFALIELALGKRLSQIREDRDKPEGHRGSVSSGSSSSSSRHGQGQDVFFREESHPQQDVDLADYCTAIHILNSNEIEDDVGVAYQRVIDACLRCRVISDGGLKLLKSDSGKFESDLKQFVVEPLRQHHSSTWGDKQILTY